MDFFFLVGRIVLGVYFIISGYRHFQHLEGNTAYAKSKGLPMAREGVILSGAMLVLGGAGILLDLYTKLAIWLVVIFLVAAAFQMHRYWKEEGMAKMAERINFEKNLALAGALIMLQYYLVW